MGHSTLLVIDIRRRTYSLFDPNDLSDQWYAHGLQDVIWEPHTLNGLLRDREDIHGPLVRTYRFEPRTQTPPALQSVIARARSPRCEPGVDRPKRFARRDADRYHHPFTISDGLCVLVTTLVYVCCRRFRYPDPWKMAETIRVLHTATVRTRTGWRPRPPSAIQRPGRTSACDCTTGSGPPPKWTAGRTWRGLSDFAPSARPPRAAVHPAPCIRWRPGPFARRRPVRITCTARAISTNCFAVIPPRLPTATTSFRGHPTHREPFRKDRPPFGCRRESRGNERRRCDIWLTPFGNCALQ